MRKLIFFVSLLVNLSAAQAAFAGMAPGTGIYQSIHDLTNGPGGSGAPLSVPGFSVDIEKRLCSYCHTPHHAILPGSAEANNADYLPLWSHQVSIINYSPYVSATFSPKGGVSMAADPLAGPSRLCMSCHDGVTAVDNYYGEENNHAMTPLPTPPFPGMPVISSNGSTSHPLGFAMIDVIPGYPGAMYPDTNILPLNDSSTYVTGYAGTGPTIISRLFGRVLLTCATCHDAHNSLNKVSYLAGTQNYLLLGSQLNSDLCLSCHTVASGVSGPAHNWP